MLSLGRGEAEIKSLVINMLSLRDPQDILVKMLKE